MRTPVLQRVFSSRLTHNIQQAARVSDLTALFWLGRLVEVDRTEKIFTDPREEITEAYVTGRFG